MSGVLNPTGLVSVEEYLATEPFSLHKREYLAGEIYRMPGASESHNRISMNLYGMLYNRLRGQVCKPFGSDMKLRLYRGAGNYFYYPDAMIACDPTDSPGETWKERPAVIFEVQSPSTRNVDAREKRMAYLDLPSLRAYVRIEQNRPRVTVDSREEEGQEWEQTRCRGLETIATIPALKMELPLRELYERLDFAR